jgi:hypothetical protein
VPPGWDFGWPYCSPDQDLSHPAGSLADVPFVPGAVTNPGGRRLDCALYVSDDTAGAVYRLAPPG